MLDPYQPGKIPVVFVHGLASSPLAWTNALNDLRADPEMRKRYQFWMFFYSTGNSIIKSSRMLRESLLEIRRELDPEGRDPAFQQMVLVGHSMGGILSRLAVSSSGWTVWNTAFKVPPERLDVDPEFRQQLMDLTFFEPVPDVKRVVFIATPHRGSPLGDQFVGRLASSLVRLPKSTIEMSQMLLKLKDVENISTDLIKNRRAFTSVAQLGEKNPLLRLLNRLPISERVAYHSIIGYNGRNPLPDGSDGVVPYESAHLDGALSEVIVTSDHSAQERTASIVELRRILVRHLDEVDDEAIAAARGLPQPPRITRADGFTPIRYVLTPPVEPKDPRVIRLEELSAAPAEETRRR
jgi:pimeloyl-ACP methyl ester carboxylesterase